MRYYDKDERDKGWFEVDLNMNSQQYFGKIKRTGITIDKDEWDTGITIDDPNHYLKSGRSRIHHSGLFMNRKIHEQKKEARRRLAELREELTFTSPHIDRMHMKARLIISIFASVAVAGIIFLVGLNFFSNKKTDIPKDIPVVERTVIVDDKYGATDKY